MANAEFSRALRIFYCPTTACGPWRVRGRTPRLCGQSLTSRRGRRGRLVAIRQGGPSVSVAAVNTICHPAGHRPRASNTRSCPHWLQSAPAPAGRRPQGPGGFRPRRPVLPVWRLRAKSASLVPTGPGDGTWARVQRHGQGSGGGGPVCERRHIGCHLPSGFRRSWTDCQ
jgi:hypothetical protein